MSTAKEAKPDGLEPCVLPAESLVSVLGFCFFSVLLN